MDNVTVAKAIGGNLCTVRFVRLSSGMMNMYRRSFSGALVVHNVKETITSADAKSAYTNLLSMGYKIL